MSDFVFLRVNQILFCFSKKQIKQCRNYYKIIRHVDLGGCLSEQAKLFLLQRKLEDIRKTRRNITISVIVLAVLLGVGGNLYGLDFGTVMILSLGLMVLGLFWSSMYSKQENAILGEIQRMARVMPKCSSCGKQIPEGNFDFCPFCGKSLEKD